MFFNYLKIILRHFSQNRVYTLINIAGLGIGIAAVVWAYQNYRFCFSFDNFHPEHKTVFRALVTKEGSEGLKGAFPLGFLANLQQDAPVVKEMVRLTERGLDIKGDQSEPFAETVRFTDPTFFSVFHFPLVQGVADLSQQNTILITEEMATKYFGTQNPIGKTLVIYSGEPYQMPLTVKGVLKKTPMNSTIHFDFLTHFDNLRFFDGNKIDPHNWVWFLEAVFFKLSDPTKADDVVQIMRKYLPQQNEARQDWKVTGFKLLSLQDHAARTDIDFNSLQNRPDDSAVYGPFVLAILIFLSACLNFANTTVARSNRRLKEMGVRKALGGNQRQLIGQLLSESAAIVFLGILLSMVFNHWWIPTFNRMFVFTDAKANYLNDPALLTFLGVCFLGSTLLAGAYPAFYISRFNPTGIFRGSVKFGGTNLFSRILLGFQVAISLMTVIAGIAFAKNSEFQRTYDYGYDHENVLGFQLSDPSSYEAMRSKLLQMPLVEHVAGTRHHIGRGYRFIPAEAEGNKYETAFLEVGSGYLETMGLKLNTGRAFDEKMESDYEQALLISEKLAASFGWTPEQALGKQMRLDTIQYSIIGVLEDFHSNQLFDPILPVAFSFARPNRYFSLIIRSKPGEVNQVFEQTKTAWATLFPLKPFRGFYQNEVAAEAYNVTTNITKIFLWFAVISVLLTSTGLFALISLTILKKMKEIAVRRIVGASPRHIAALINKGYLWIFLIATILGCYGGYALTKLLMDLIFTVNVGVGIYTLLLSSVAIFVITGGAVAYKIWQAIRENPAGVLKGE